MKYIEYFENYSNSKLPIKEIDIEKFKDLIKENCSQFLKVASKIDWSSIGYRSSPNELLFRKFNSNWGDFLFTIPKDSSHKRLSPWSNSNWHNLIVSNLESWSEYPKRNKSMICAGFRRSSSHVGDYLYLVIPFDSTKLGVCNNKDFWESFNVWNEKYYFNDWAFNIIDKLSYLTGVSFGLGRESNSWHKLLPHLNKKYDYKFFEGYDVDKTLLENLDVFLDPKDNKFRLKTFSGVARLQRDKCVECWFEDSAVLVSWNYLLGLGSKGIKELFDIE